MQILALFCNLITLISGYNYVKGLRVTNAVKEIKFKKVWGELKIEKLFSREKHSQYI